MIADVIMYMDIPLQYKYIVDEAMSDRDKLTDHLVTFIGALLQSRLLYLQQKECPSSQQKSRLGPSIWWLFLLKYQTAPALQEGADGWGVGAK